MECLIELAVSKCQIYTNLEKILAVAFQLCGHINKWLQKPLSVLSVVQSVSTASWKVRYIVLLKGLLSLNLKNTNLVVHGIKLQLRSINLTKAQILHIVYRTVTLDIFNFNIFL